MQHDFKKKKNIYEIKYVINQCYDFRKIYEISQISNYNMFLMHST